jgi:YD repeat-containing protein
VYDPNQRLVGSTSPTGQTTHLTYDARGVLASALDSNGLTALSYDDFGRIVRVSYPGETASTMAYAAPVLRTTCPHAFLGTFAAPEDDRPTADDCFITIVNGVRVFLNGSFSVPAPLNPVVAAFRVTSSGVVVALVNGRGDDAQVMGSDALRSIASPMGQAVTLQQNALHVPSRLTDALAATTSYSYDSSGRMTTVTDALGRALHFAWTAVGRLSSVTDTNGSLVASFTYDGNGRLLSAMDGLGIVTSLFWSADHLESIRNALGSGLLNVAEVRRRNQTAVAGKHFACRAHDHLGLGGYLQHPADFFKCDLRKPDVREFSYHYNLPVVGGGKDPSRRRRPAEVNRARQRFVKREQRRPAPEHRERGACLRKTIQRTALAIQFQNEMAGDVSSVAHTLAPDDGECEIDRHADRPVKQ